MTFTFFFTLSFKKNVHKEQGHFCSQKSPLVITARHRTGPEHSGRHGEPLFMRINATSSLWKQLRLCGWGIPASVCAQTHRHSCFLGICPEGAARISAEGTETLRGHSETRYKVRHITLLVTHRLLHSSARRWSTEVVQCEHKKAHHLPGWLQPRLK